MARNNRVRMKLESLEGRRLLAAGTELATALKPTELAEAYGTVRGEAGYSKDLDFDGDSDIDALDLIQLRSGKPSAVTSAATSFSVKKGVFETDGAINETAEAPLVQEPGVAPVTEP